MLFDTDVLIWAFRGNAAAIRLIDRTEERHVSAVTYMELLQGALNRSEIKRIQSFFRDLGFAMLPLSENIGHRASIYVEEYALSDSLYLADALQAATAVENRLALCTGNTKHFKKIRDLEVKAFRAR